MNKKLVKSFKSGFTHSPPWKRLLCEACFDDIEASLLDSIAEKMAEVVESAPSVLRQKVERQTNLCIEEARTNVHTALDTARLNANMRQKTIAGELQTYLQAALGEAYVKARAETGHGSVQRMKVSCVRNGLDSQIVDL